MHAIIAKFTVKEGKKDTFLEAIEPLIKASQQEEGCLEYQLNKSIDHPDVFVFSEKWKDLEAIAKHEVAPHCLKAAPIIEETAVAEIQKFEIVEL